MCRVNSDRNSIIVKRQQLNSTSNTTKSLWIWFNFDWFSKARSHLETEIHYTKSYRMSSMKKHHVAIYAFLKQHWNASFTDTLICAIIGLSCCKFYYIAIRIEAKQCECTLSCRIVVEFSCVIVLKLWESYVNSQNKVSISFVRFIFSFLHNIYQ